MLALLNRFENNKVFSEEESWLLFRIAAIAEACGWTLLILGIGIEKYILPGNNTSVLLAGRTHGMLFIAYALAAIGLYPTLLWSRKKAFIALLASVPPYGSLMFEQWAKHVRETSYLKTYSRCLLLNLAFQQIEADG